MCHMSLCLLPDVLWRTLAQRRRQADPGDEPRKVLEELQTIGWADVVLPTRGGAEPRRRCVTHLTPHQAILLQRLGLSPPQHPATHDMLAKVR